MNPFQKVISEVEDHPLMAAAFAVAGFIILLMVFTHRQPGSQQTMSTPGSTDASTNTTYNVYNPPTNDGTTTVPPIVPPGPPVRPPIKKCNVEQFHGCIYDYNKAHPHHKGGEAHKHCRLLMPECKGIN